MAERRGRFELLTPRGPGGVAVVAVRGPDRWSLVAGLLVDRPVPRPVPVLAALGWEGAELDEVLLVDRPEVSQLELHLHGAPAVIRALEERVGGFVPVAADPVEAGLRHAQTPEQVALCLEQRDGLDPFLASLTDVPAAARAAQLDAAIERSRVACAMLAPRRLVLCGDQNAGKSTLMNRLVFAERVLTGPHPGLTRDPVREAAILGGYPYEVVDTAGEGEVAAALDREAQVLARGERAGAILLLVVDGSRPPSATVRAIRTPDSLVVRSKADLSPAVWPQDFGWDLETCCLDPGGAPAIRRAVGLALRTLRRLPPAGPVGGPAALDPAGVARLRDAIGRPA